MFDKIYHLNVLKSRIDGIDNKTLSELCLKESDDLRKRKDQDPSATGYEDSPLNAGAPAVRQLRETIKKIMHDHIDSRLQEGELWGHVQRFGEATQIHSHRNKKDYDLLSTSWVYYPCIPEDAHERNVGGQIVFQIQVGGVRTVNKHYNPQEGEFIIFPSWLPHFTTRNISEHVRISISGNYRVPIKDYEEVSRDHKSNIRTLTGF